MVDNPIPETVFIGSHLKANVGFGTGGDPNASSLLPGQTVKRSPEGKAIIGNPDATLAAIAARGVHDNTQSAAPSYTGVDSSQTRPVSTAPLASSPTMHDPNAGRFSGKVPANGRPVTGSGRTNDGPVRAFKG
jgi:hypothetical protein